MFTAWMTLRQADEALQGGRLEEALRLAGSPEVQGHKRAGELKALLAKALLERAQLRLKHQDPAAAWRDLELVESAGIQNSELIQFRGQLVQGSLEEVHRRLERGQPDQAEGLLSDLARRAPQQPELCNLFDAVRGWQLAQELSARGEMAQACVSIEKAAKNGGRRWQGLEDYRRDLARRRKEFEELSANLHEALEQSRFREVIGLADQMLAIAPLHTVARRARERAWNAVQPPTLVLKPNAPRPVEKVEELPRRFLLWIDGVGGYLICLSPRVSLGQATPDAAVDVPIFADISRLHAYLSRDSEGYLLEAVRPVAVNGSAVERRLLRDGDRLTLGEGCKLTFHRPMGVSQTARLAITSGHRLPLAVDGVLLMAETCVLAPAGDAHVQIPDLKRPVVLHRQGDNLSVHAAGGLVVDGQSVRDRTPLNAGATVSGEDFRLTLEPLGPQVGK